MTTVISYETVAKWFAKAAHNAAAQGKNDSATLWKDGLEHLEAMRLQRDEAENALKNLAEDVNALVAFPLDKLKAARAVLKKASKRY